MRKVLFILGQLSDTDVDWLTTTGSKQVLQTGQAIIHEGEASDALYIVLDGDLTVSIAALPGQEIDRLGVGEIVGEMSFVDARPPSATVQAKEESVVLAIPRDMLEEKLAEDTAFSANFFKAMSMFLSFKLRTKISQLADYEVGGSLSEEVEYEDELDENLLDAVYIAGLRFDQMLKNLMMN